MGPHSYNNIYKIFARDGRDNNNNMDDGYKYIFVRSGVIERRVGGDKREKYFFFYYISM